MIVKGLICIKGNMKDECHTFTIHMRDEKYTFSDLAKGLITKG
jgi:hypothetical protein